MRPKTIAMIVAVIAAAGISLYFLNAQMPNYAGHNLTGHSSTHSNNVMPTQQGQAAFAAIAEIVTLLNQNPNTDWERVDIDRLREHLVDMNNLTTSAQVETSMEDGGIKFTVRGSGNVLRAIKNMVPAHTRELNKITTWNALTSDIKEGVILTLKPEGPTELAKLKALGFFGIMATGAHHQPHHLAMATGQRHGH